MVALSIVKFGLFDHFIGRAALLLRILRMDDSVVLKADKDSYIVISLGLYASL